MISKKTIEQLKAKLDIVDVIGNYIELHKAGANYKALCPFHEEDTPSFVVSPQKEIYHCFGCQASGDAIKFVMEYEKISYPEAIEKLAYQYNIPIIYEKSSHNIISQKDILEKINDYYVDNLYKNKEAYNYLKQRGIIDNSIETFSLGYAPDSINQLNFFKKFPENDLIQTGVLVKDKKIYPRLIERITFPIFSQSGKIIAFGGRTLSNHPAKYINFSNTIFFNKSNTFYGYNFAKEHIIKQKEAIIVEGYFDVIMLHQAGYKTAIATLGTALTPHHLPLLKKLDTQNVKILYDSDKAGVNAAFKAAYLLYNHSFKGEVVLLPQNLDPADAIKERIDLDKFLQNGTPLNEFIVNYIVKRYNLNDYAQKQMVIEELQNILNGLNEILKDDFFNTITQSYPSLAIHLKISKSKTSYHKQQNRANLAELSVIKTILLKSNLSKTLDTYAEYIIPELFSTHQDLINYLFKEELDKLNFLLLDDKIITLDDKSLEQQIILLWLEYIKRVLTVTTNIEKKRALNLMYQTFIKALKNKTPLAQIFAQGDIIESISTI